MGRRRLKRGRGGRRPTGDASAVDTPQLRAKIAELLEDAAARGLPTELAVRAFAVAVRQGLAAARRERVVVELAGVASTLTGDELIAALVALAEEVQGDALAHYRPGV
jgi:hypothetical protein